MTANYNPKLHHRSSIRLKGYDYSQEGLYFVTICVHNMECIFGEIKNTPLVGAGSARPYETSNLIPQMHLNNYGKIVEQCYLGLEQKYPNIQCGEYVIMPNHFHAIIAIGSSIKEDGICDNWAGKPRPYNVTLGRIIGYFKYQSTKLIDLHDQILWQRNYYEHIIRNEISYNNIYWYIMNNPQKWEEDKFWKG